MSSGPLGIDSLPSRFRILWAGLGFTLSRAIEVGNTDLRWFAQYINIQLTWCRRSRVAIEVYQVNEVGWINYVLSAERGQRWWKFW